MTATAEADAPLAVYVHWPYCARICPYCDFNVIRDRGRTDDADALAEAILADLDHPLEQDVLVCGDSREDKREAANLIERIEGLRCVDCGRLEMARIAESLTALLISVNACYKVHAGIRLTGLPDPSWE